MNRVIALLVVAGCFFSVFVAHARADAAAATKYIDDATTLLGKGSQFFDDASAKLDLAEASLDDVPAADKPALQAKIDDVKKQLQNAAGSEDKTRIDRQVKQLLDEVEAAVGNLVVWPGKADELTTLLNDPKTKQALGEPAVSAYQKKFATLNKVHQGKALKANLANATTEVEGLEKTWADAKAKLADPALNDEQRDPLISQTQRDLGEIDRFFKDLPADNADVKALQARVDKVKTDNAAAGASSAATSEIARINRYFEGEKEEFDGMDAETTGPTWAEFRSGKEMARELNAPKTINYTRKVGYFLANLDKEPGYAATKDDPKVKQTVADINKKLGAARTKLSRSATKVLDEAEKEKLNADNISEISSLQSVVEMALGTDSAEGKTLAARITKMRTDFQAAGDKADADKDAYYKSMTDQANKAWPAMMQKFDIADGFDPNNADALKGKYIKLIGNNLMGWSFKHGDFPYATKVNGVPVAGKYDPAVKAALAEVEAKLGRAIGDNDSDGEWTAIAHVDGGRGKLVQLVKSSGDVKVDGSNVGTVEATDERPVDAPIVTIVALKAGPVAVAQGQGAVKADGSIGASAPVAGAAGSRHGFSLFGIITGLLAITVGAACLMKAKFAPLAANAEALKLTDKIGGQNIAYLGLAGIALGALGLLMNLLALPHAFLSALIGLIASAAMIVAGGVASRDFLYGRGILPAQADQIFAKFAVPAGLTCAALGVLTLLLSLF